MGITPNFNSNDLNRMQREIERQSLEKAVKAFEYIGETLIAHARDNVGFTDQTGNLRSSIGYVLFVNGRIHKSNYTGTSEGNAEGKQLALEVKANIPNQPIVLVCTAGMNYAYSVETKGYNVLAATENYAQGVTQQLLRQLLK